jgi:uncharacterized protein (TIGR02678 family)
MSASVPAFELAAYQRAMRTVLMNPLITETFPDTDALPLIRRWTDQLRNDLSELFGYRLELARTTARLIRVTDELDATTPVRTTTDRPFDRRRYAYLALTVAALGRAGPQLALSELADAVATDANRIDGLGLSTERAADRAAFVDAVAWLETRGALRLADGSARRWADDPNAGEALYDIDRDVAFAVYRPTKVLQHVRSVTALLATPTAASRDTLRRESSQRARRALIERPVVYFAEADPNTRNALRAPHATADVERVTGLIAERRAEGIALLDTSGSFSDRRFPGTGTVAQTALLLIGEIADRIDDPGLPGPSRLVAPDLPDSTLAAQVDAGLPAAGVLSELASEQASVAAIQDDQEAPTHPLFTDGWLRSAMTGLVERYGSTFAAQWRADPDRLLGAALDLLAELRIIARVEAGVLALPLLARYRNVVVEVRRRKSEQTLFDGLL